MFTIIMDNKKQLIATVVTNIYQHEKLVDKIQFLFPQTYGDLNISGCKAILKYIDQGNVPHAEILQQDTNLYKDHVRFSLPIDTDLTQFAGNLTLRITLTKVDMDTKTQYVLNTSEITIKISPLKDYYAFIPDESLEFVDQLVGNLETKIEATEKIAEIYDKKKADNIIYEDSKLQLTSNGQKIGNAITFVGSDAPSESTEFEVVEF